jgi:glycosyltransferase involved in cell wall biosynthesis
MAERPPVTRLGASRPVVVIFGDVDLNYLDGSSVWLTSLGSVLAQLDVDIHVVLKSDILRGILTDSIVSIPNLRLWEPTKLVGTPILRGKAISDALKRVDAEVRAKIVITRGRAATKLIAESESFDGRLWPYLTDIPQQPEVVTEEFLEEMEFVFDRSGRILCQTEQLRSFLASFFPAADSKMILLPPMIPDGIEVPAKREQGRSGLRLFYAGKFAPAWGIEELCSQVAEVQKGHPDVVLTIAGDKFHNPPDDPGYADRVRKALDGDGVRWLGAITRSQVFEELRQTDLALSVRDASLDTSRELSTKLLEYAAAGVPVVANRTLMHEELFGLDYPLLVDSYGDISRVVRAVADNPELLDHLVDRVTAVARQHSYSSVAGSLDRVIRSDSSQGDEPRLDGVKVAIASHDLKFAGMLIDELTTAGAELRYDHWRGGRRHDEAHSRDLIEWADVVFAEWCLANAAWYSENRRASQKLLIRFHRTEINTEWPEMIDLNSATGVYFVSDYMREKAAQKFEWPSARLYTIPNFVDAIPLDRPKLPGAEFNLGMLGYVPRRKRLDLALDLLEQLRATDRRYRLILKGKLPWELNWVWTNPEQRRYLEDQFNRVRSSPLLRSAVTFDRAGPDVPSWFRKIGVVLSFSDDESFHLAMIEGMLSRAIPLVLERPGAAGIVSPEWIHRDVDQAAAWLNGIPLHERAAIGARAHQDVSPKYDKKLTGEAWRRAIAASVGLIQDVRAE